MNEKFKAVADQIVKTMDLVSKLPKSRETSITFTKLEESMMWLLKANTMDELNQRVPGIGPKT